MYGFEKWVTAAAPVDQDTERLRTVTGSGWEVWHLAMTFDPMFLLSLWLLDWLQR